MARQPTPKPATAPRTVALIVGGAVVLAALLYAAFGIATESGPGVAEVAGAPSVEGGALPPLEDPQDDPAMGQAAPSARGEDFDGSAVTVGGDGPEIVVFMASWCPACDAELPELSAFLRDGRLPEGVTLTSVATLHDANRPNWPPQDWFAAQDYPGPVLVDDADSSVADAFGLTATPFWVFLDDGHVVGRASGQLPMDVVAQVAEDLAGP